MKITKSHNSPAKTIEPSPTLTENSLLKVGEAAKFLGVSIDTLRRWEERGVLTPFRTPGSTRLYTGKQLLEVNPSLKFIRNPNFNRSLSRKIIGFGLTYASYTAAFFTVIAVVYFATANNTAKFLSNLPFVVNFEKSLLRHDSVQIDPRKSGQNFLASTGAKLELSEEETDRVTDLAQTDIPPITQSSSVRNSWQSAYESCMLELETAKRELQDK